jgi:hypothetical protein
MKQDTIMKILFSTVSIIFALVAFIFNGALTKQEENDVRLERRIDGNSARIEELGNVYEALGRIDERLKNIERAVK